MKLLIIIGNTAVGKMTVGQELMKITGLRLFHNHMMIEPVIEIFGNLQKSTVTRLREIIFEDFAASDNYGMIFTFMWIFERQSSRDYIEHICDIFKNHNADIYFAELIATQEERLKRNHTENRLKNKASKRDIAISDYLFFEADNNHRCESEDGEITYENYIRIDNTDLPPEAAALIIKERFLL